MPSSGSALGRLSRAVGLYNEDEHVPHYLLPVGAARGCPGACVASSPAVVADGPDLGLPGFGSMWYGGGRRRGGVIRGATAAVSLLCSTYLCSRPAAFLAPPSLGDWPFCCVSCVGTWGGQHDPPCAMRSVGMPATSPRPSSQPPLPPAPPDPSTPPAVLARSPTSDGGVSALSSSGTRPFTSPGVLNGSLTSGGGVSAPSSSSSVPFISPGVLAWPPTSGGGVSVAAGDQASNRVGAA